MNTKLLAIGAFAALAIAIPAAALDLSTIEVVTAPWTAVHCDSPEVHANRELGLDPYTHTWVDPSAPDMTVTLHLLCYEEGVVATTLTDCTATSWSHTGWKWNTVENFRVRAGGGISASTAVSIFQTSGDTWDNQVAANIFGSMSSTTTGSVPVFDGVNLFNWANLASTTIASTWTWSSGGVASESDASYNTDFLWSTSGQSGRMDLQNIATHELGHTFGMGHSSSSSVNSCLTMYPSGSTGETQKRTLGDGDINGIKARYP